MGTVPYQQNTIRYYTVLFSCCVNYVVTKEEPRSDLTENYFSRIFIRIITKSTSYLTCIMRENYFVA
jgi:hypothetical protein